jgi:hypothetical protein
LTDYKAKPRRYAMDKDRTAICKIMSDMFNDVDKHGIYPTSTAYTRLELRRGSKTGDCFVSENL